MAALVVLVMILFLVYETRETEEINVRVAQQGIESLNEIERTQYMTRRMEQWSAYETAYYARQQGVLEDSEWFRVFGQICQNCAVESEAWEGITARGGVARSLTPEFRLYTEVACR
jgi:hypothetical protein